MLRRHDGKNEDNNNKTSAMRSLGLQEVVGAVGMVIKAVEVAAVAEEGEEAVEEVRRQSPFPR